MSLILAGAGLAASAIGAGINAFQNAKANRLAEEHYNNTRGQLLTDMYASPLDSVANKALLSQNIHKETGNWFRTDYKLPADCPQYRYVR